MNLTQKLATLYANLSDASFLPSTFAIRDCLGSENDDNRAFWTTWGSRNEQIAFHAYSRVRDENRAIRQNDFNLARALDQAAA